MGWGRYAAIEPLIQSMQTITATSYTGECNTCLMQFVESVIARVANPRIIFFELVFYILVIMPCLSVVIIKICSL